MFVTRRSRARVICGNEVEMAGELAHAWPMKPALMAWLTLLGCLLLPGCSQRAAPSAPAAATEPRRSGQPQPKLPMIKLWLGPKEILAEQAYRPEQVQAGLMFRKEMPENEGMLFIFSRPHQASFWMRNTVLPLTCAYIDSAGIILEIRDMIPLNETPIEAASDQVQYVLEMNQGWFARNQITPGTVVRTDKGSLNETYFNRP
jgi:uncharacterized protein